MTNDRSTLTPPPDDLPDLTDDDRRALQSHDDLSHHGYGERDGFMDLGHEKTSWQILWEGPDATGQFYVVAHTSFEARSLAETKLQPGQKITGVTPSAYA